MHVPLTRSACRDELKSRSSVYIYIYMVIRTSTVYLSVKLDYFPGHRLYYSCNCEREVVEAV